MNNPSSTSFIEIRRVCGDSNKFGSDESQHQNRSIYLYGVYCSELL